MTESDNQESLIEEKVELSFGESLLVERKRQNLSAKEVAKAIHLSEKVIEAIDCSDISALPQPTFVQGYLRAYAKYLGISDVSILEEYAKTVPHHKESDLHARSTLPDEASSNSPLIKMITTALLLMMLMAALYASFDYYRNAIATSDEVAVDQSSITLPMSDSIDDEIEVAIELDLQTEDVQSEKEIMPVVETLLEEEESAVTIVAESEQVQFAQDGADSQRSMNQLVVDGDDSLVLSAEQVTWLEVDDANGENLYYDLLQEDQELNLQGVAPFKIFIGNAPHVQITMNDISVNIEKYIRSNNIAHFNISVDQQQIVFH